MCEGIGSDGLLIACSGLHCSSHSSTPHRPVHFYSTAADLVDIDPSRSSHLLRRPPPTLVDRSSPILKHRHRRQRQHRSTSTSTVAIRLRHLLLHAHRSHSDSARPDFDHSHEVVYHEITDDDKTFALRLNEKLDVRVAEIAKSEQARKESEAQARKAHQTRTLTEEEIAEALAGLRLCKAQMVPRITLSVPELFLTEPENQDEEDARFAEQQVSARTDSTCLRILCSNNSFTLSTTSSTGSTSMDRLLQAGRPSFYVDRRREGPGDRG
jgi:hypothetical protein